MLKLLSNLASRLRRDENFFVVFWNGDAKLVTKVATDFKNRRLRIFDTEENPDLKNLRNVIIAFDGQTAQTVRTIFEFEREKPRKQIDEAEADNFVANAMRKFLDDERPAAAEKLGLDSSEIVLADFKVWEVWADGKPVISPLNLSPKKIGLLVSGTMVSKKTADELDSSFPPRAARSISEKSAATARVVFESQRNLNNKAYIFADVTEQKTNFFEAGEARIAPLDSFAWGHNSVKNALIEKLALEEDLARHVNYVYNFKQYPSPAFSKKVGETLAGEYNIFVSGLANVARRSKLQGMILRIGPGAPREVLEAKIKNMSGKNVRISTIPQDGFGRLFDFVIQLNKGVAADSDYPVASVLDFYLAPTEKFLNELVVRRLRWLKQNRNI